MTESDFWRKASENNPYYYIATSRTDWSKDEFLADGAWRVSRWVVSWLLQNKIDLAGCDLLEIGCGAGRFAYNIAPLVGSYTGVDLAEEYLRKAREVLVGIGQTEFINNNGEGLSMIDSESVDAVFSYAVLQHVYLKKTILNYVDETIRI